MENGKEIQGFSSNAERKRPKGLLTLSVRAKIEIFRIHQRIIKERK